MATVELPSRAGNSDSDNLHLPVTSRPQENEALEESIAELERRGLSDKIEGFVKARTEGEGGVAVGVGSSIENPDEIDIGNEEVEDVGTAGEGIDVEQTLLPETLFSRDLEVGAGDKSAGALDRFKRQKL